MKFTIDKDVLLEKLNIVSGPALQNHIQPILTTIKFTTAQVDNFLDLEATDTNLTIFTILNIDIEENGTICVPARNLINILKEMPEGKLNFELIKNKLVIKQKNIELKLNLFDTKEFPVSSKFKHHTELSINSKELERILYLVSFCADKTARIGFELSSVLFGVMENKINIVATDGKRLACIKNSEKVDKSFVIPLEVIEELFKILRNKDEEVTILISDKKIMFQIPETTLIASLLENKYPDYRSFIPEEKKEKLRVDRKNLLSALKRANSLDDKAITMDINKDYLLISKINSYFGEIKEKIKIDYKDKSLIMRFNAQYLIDVLNLFDDEKINIEIFAEDKPIVIRKDNYIYLTLPIVI